MARGKVRDDWRDLLLDLKRRGLDVAPELMIADGAHRAESAPSARRFWKAADCLAKDRDALLAYYDFPAEHWKHL